MADITYSVAVEYYSKGRIDSGIDAAHRKANAFAGKIGSMASSFNSMFDSAASTMVSGLMTAASVAGTALAAGVGVAVHEMMKFNEQMENAKISLAAISVGTGESSNMAQGMRIASTAVAQMRKDAAMLPGSFSDLQSTLTLIMPALGHAGVGTSGGETIAARLMTAGKIEGINPGVVAREYAALIEGRATSRMPLFTKLGLGAAKDFNQLSMGDRLAKTNRAIEKFTGSLSDPNSAMSIYAGSWNAIKETAMDNVRMAVGTTGGDLFERVKARVANFNDIGKGERGAAVLDRLVPLSHQISANLVRGFDWAFGRAEEKLPGIGGKLEEFGDLFVTIPAQVGVITRIFEEWRNPVRYFFETMHGGFARLYTQAEPILAQISKHLQSFMLDPQAFDKMASVAKSLLALRAGSGMLSGAASGLQALGGSGAGLKMIGGAAAAGPIAVALGVLAVAGYGAAHALMDGSSQFHSLAVNQTKEIGTHMSKLSVQLARLLEKSEPLVDFMGVVLLETVRNSTFIFEKLVTAVNWSVEAINAWNDLLQGKGWKAPGDRIAEQQENDTIRREMLELTAEQRTNAYMMTKLFDTNALGEKEEKAKPPNHTTHIHKVELKVISNQDPSRIAKATVKVLEDFARRPRTSPFDPNPRF